MEETRRYLINPSAVAFLKQTLESYEEVALFSVLDGKKGLIEIIYPLCLEGHVQCIIQDMGRYGIIFQEADDV